MRREIFDPYTAARRAAARTPRPEADKARRLVGRYAANVSGMSRRVGEIAAHLRQIAAVLEKYGAEAARVDALDARATALVEAMEACARAFLEASEPLAAAKRPRPEA